MGHFPRFKLYSKCGDDIIMGLFRSNRPVKKRPWLRGGAALEVVGLSVPREEVVAPEAPTPSPAPLVEAAKAAETVTADEAVDAPSQVIESELGQNKRKGKLFSGQNP